MFAEASSADIFFHCHDQGIFFRGSPEQVCVHRTYKTGVCNGAGNPPGGKYLPGLFRRFYHTSHSEQQDAAFFLLIDHLCASLLQRSAVFGEAVIGGSAGIADRGRPAQSECKAEHIRELLAVLGGHDGQPGDRGQPGKIKDPLMGLSVRSYDPGPVNGKDHRKLLQADILHDLVISALQKR